jgi:hypothetical protein
MWRDYGTCINQSQEHPYFEIIEQDSTFGFGFHETELTFNCRRDSPSARYDIRAAFPISKSHTCYGSGYNYLKELALFDDPWEALPEPTYRIKQLEIAVTKQVRLPCMFGKLAFRLDCS